MPPLVRLREQETRDVFGEKYRGPLANAIIPTHITHDGYYQVELPAAHAFKNVIECKMIRRSNDMIYRGCDGCIRHHNECNPYCAASGNAPIIDEDKDLGEDIIELWSMKEPRERYRGQWRILEKCEFPKRYKCGTMTLESLE